MLCAEVSKPAEPMIVLDDETYAASTTMFMTDYDYELKRHQAAAEHISATAGKGSAAPEVRFLYDLTASCISG